jgi:putative DNA primase/helicase
MRRKRANDQVSNFRSDCADDLNILARKAARWAADNYENLSHDPEIPAGLFNRVADNWRVLLAIADCAGGEWPERARKVAVSLSERKDDDSIRIKLIGAVRDIFIERGLERMASAEICEALVAIEDGPWKEWRRGQPITATQLSHQLAHHEIKSRQIKFSGMNKRGFSFDQINDVFTRYTPNQSATPLPCPETMAYSPNQSATPENKVALQNPLKPALSNEGSRVALPDPEYGELKCEKGIFEL